MSTVATSRLELMDRAINLSERCAEMVDWATNALDASRVNLLMQLEGMESEPDNPASELAWVASSMKCRIGEMRAAARHLERIKKALLDIEAFEVAPSPVW
jgi:hypothetical protein